MAQASGPNQHFLPQFLQRGFSLAGKRKNPFVFFFQRNGSITERQINSIGADEYFYGHPSESAVDEELKKWESRFGSMVAQLRKIRVSQAVSDPLMPKLFAHMAIRTKNLRDSFSDAADRAMHGLADQSETPEGQAYLQRQLDAEMSKQLNQEPVRSLIAQMPPTARKQLMEQIVSFKEGLNLTEQFGLKVRQIAGIVDFAKIAGDAHVKSLANFEGGMPRRIDVLQPLNWFLNVQPPGTYVLGDIAVMAQHQQDDLLQSPLKEKDTPYAIFLPLSDKHLLVGSIDEASRSINPESVNESSAELSIDFFIASRNGGREQSYATRLGNRDGLLTNDEFDKVLQSIVEED